MSRTALGEFEHHVMLALVRIGGRSRGAPIVLELEAATGRTISPAAVFVALRRLEQRGYARSSKREARPGEGRSEEHTSELQSLTNLVCRLLLEKKKKNNIYLFLVQKKKKNKK